MIISNKPNIKGMSKVSEDVKYRTGLIGRDLRLYMGLISTRVYGISIGIIIVFLLIAVPAFVVLYGGA